MISLEPHIATPYVGTQGNLTMTLAPAHRKRINQLAHAHALRVELEIRDRWIAELTAALTTGATFAQIQERIAKLAS